MTKFIYFILLSTDFILFIYLFFVRGGGGGGGLNPGWKKLIFLLASVDYLHLLMMLTAL